MSRTEIRLSSSTTFSSGLAILVERVKFLGSGGRGGYDQVVAAVNTATLTGHGRGQRSFQPAPVASYSSTRARISAFSSSVGSSRS